VITALRWITDDSGFAFRIREYHYAGREAFQQPWLWAINAAIPATQVSLCVGANGTTNEVPTMIGLQQDLACGVAFLEGLNEPNTDFGSGMVPVETTLAIQQAVWLNGALPSPIMGPSIVAGMPHPEGWITGYCGDEMGAINHAMTHGNGHYYPPGQPDAHGSGTSLEEYVAGLREAYAGHPVYLTEFHPTLYNAAGRRPGEPGWDGLRDAYYTLMALFRCGKLGVGLWWYALFDYGTTYSCGLFPTKAEKPRPAAEALRRLCAAVHDAGPTMRTFEPGNLGLEVRGLDADCAWSLYQASDGRFFIPLWRAAEEPGLRQPLIVDVMFGPAVRHVVEHDLLSGQTWEQHAVTRFDVWLSNDVRVLVIEP
jgi:hypothetical protein